MEAKALRAGLFLGGRQGLGLLLGALQFVVVVRLIGPEAYGAYLLGLTAGEVLARGLLLGLPRSPLWARGLGREEASLLQGGLLVLTGFGLLLAPPLGAALAKLASLQGQEAPLALLLALPLLQGAYGLPLALLERALAFRRVASLELLAQALALGVAALLSAQGLGIWAPALGQVALHGTMLLGSLLLHPVRPRLSRKALPLLLEGGRQGAGLAALEFVGSLRQTLLLALASRFLGGEGLGGIALAHKVVDYASFPASALHRLLVPLLGQVGEGRGHLLGRASLLLGLVVGSLLVLAGGLLAFFPLAQRGSLPGLAFAGAFPFLAWASLGYSLLVPAQAALLGEGRTWALARLHGLHALLLLLGAWLLLPLGVWGYGAAHLLALLAFRPLWHLLRKEAPRLASVASRWALASALALTGGPLGLPVYLLWVVLAGRRTWRLLGPGLTAGPGG